MIFQVRILPLTCETYDEMPCLQELARVFFYGALLAC